MSDLLKILLTSHVLFGLIGVSLLFVLTTSLLKINPPVIAARRYALGAALSFFASWISGGMYYVMHYGKSVKPIILAGEYPWAHFIFMEAKEHVFLFLPFLSLALFIAISYAKEVPPSDTLRRSLVMVSVATFVIALIVTLSGIVISGGAR
ncbi:MAG: hypothetical protein AAB545_02745 [Patescibacteria group bacterium]